MSDEHTYAFNSYDDGALSWSFVATPENPVKFLTVGEVDFSLSMFGTTIHAHRADICNRDALKADLAQARRERDHALDTADRYLAERDQARAEVKRLRQSPRWRPVDESLEDW